MGRRDLDYDEVLRYIGQFGTFQKRIFFWLWLVSAGGGLAVMVFAFTGLEPRYRCRVPECEASNSSTYTQAGREGLLPSWYGVDSLEGAQRCSKLVFPDGKCKGKGVLSTEQCSEKDLIYDRSVMKTTLIEDYGLVCEKAGLRTIYNSIYMLGMLFGSYIFGWISDRFGRMKALMLSTVAVSLSGFLGAFCTGPLGLHLYALLRFITGVGAIGSFMVCFVLAVEHVGFKFTMLIGIAIEMPFALGEMLLGLEAYFIRDWRTLQMVSYLPLLGLVGLWWTVPESVRWLVGVGRIKEASIIVRSAAKTNGRDVPEHLLKAADLAVKEELEVEKEKSQTGASFLDLFRPSKIAVRTLNMCFQWFSATMCYYGLSFASTSLSGDAFTNFLLSVFIEIPSAICCILVIDCWGRRPTLSFCQVVSGLACVVCGLLQGVQDPGLQTLQLVLSLVGKFGASISFFIVYLYTAELFPTTVRNQAVGICSLVARIGGITALLLDLTKVFWLPAPVFIMGVIATVAGCLATLFPETLGQKLPEDMEDALNIGVDNTRGLCTCICVSPKDMFSEELQAVPVELEDVTESSRLTEDH